MAHEASAGPKTTHTQVYGPPALPSNLHALGLGNGH